MTKQDIYTFAAVLELIDINPFVLVPEAILSGLFKTAGKEKGPIPVCGTINKKPYTQTLVRFRGLWRLYVNMEMLAQSPKKIGEEIQVTIQYNRTPAAVIAPEAFYKALAQDKEAKKIYEQLAPYLQKEISRYLSNLKTEESRTRNIQRALNFLRGEERFIGRDKPL